MRKMTLVLALAFASHATIAAAQTSEGEDDGASGEIIVTAQKREERLLEVPISISVLQGEQMVKSGITPSSSGFMASWVARTARRPSKPL